MRLSSFRFKDKQKDLPDNVKRSNRNVWCEKYEEIVRNLAPLPISYDVDSTQSLNWSEFSYTEYLAGIYVNTQNIETNTRLISLASKVEASTDHTSRLLQYCIDKYNLKNDIESDITIKHLGFMVGHNMFDLVSREIVARLAFENPEFMIKLHPLTNDEFAAMVGNNLGWDKVITQTVSGVELLKRCETAYVHSATELTTMAVLLNKKIVNIANFFNEAIGVYYPITTLLFKSSNPLQTLNNILDCKFSGIIMPYMTDEEIEERLTAYYEKAMEIREIVKPLASSNSLNKTPNKGCKK